MTTNLRPVIIPELRSPCKSCEFNQLIDCRLKCHRLAALLQVLDGETPTGLTVKSAQWDDEGYNPIWRIRRKRMLGEYDSYNDEREATQCD